MEKVLLVLVGLLLCVSTTSASEIWDDSIGVGLNGDSFFNGTAAEGAPFYGSSLPYWDFGMTLQKVSPFRVENVALGGATVWDGLPGPLYKGSVSQHEQLIRRFTWALNNKNYMQYEILQNFNSCMHYNGSFSHQPCTPAEVESVFDEMEKVVFDNAIRGITTVLPGYPDYEDLDVPLIDATYGLPWFIDKDSFKYIVKRYKERRLIWQMQYDIIITDSYEGMTHIGDGLHPDEKTQYRVAIEIMFAILLHSRP